MMKWCLKQCKNKYKYVYLTMRAEHSCRPVVCPPVSQTWQTSSPPFSSRSAPGHLCRPWLGEWLEQGPGGQEQGRHHHQALLRASRQEQEQVRWWRSRARTSDRRRGRDNVRCQNTSPYSVYETDTCTSDIEASCFWPSGNLWYILDTFPGPSLPEMNWIKSRNELIQLTTPSPNTKVIKANSIDNP